MARNKPKTALAVLACASLAALTGCVGQAEYATEPFIGFEEVGSIDETYDVYYDKGGESGLHDVMIAEGDHRMFSCLGEPLQICYDGGSEGVGELIIVIAEEGTEQVLVDYNGHELELQKTEAPEDIEEPAPIFVGQAPVLEDREGFSWSWKGLDADGEELWTR